MDKYATSKTLRSARTSTGPRCTQKDLIDNILYGFRGSAVSSAAMNADIYRVQHFFPVSRNACPVTVEGSFLWHYTDRLRGWLSQWAPFWVLEDSSARGALYDNVAEGNVSKLRSYCNRTIAFSVGRFLDIVLNFVKNSISQTFLDSAANYWRCAPEYSKKQSARLLKKLEECPPQVLQNLSVSTDGTLLVRSFIKPNTWYIVDAKARLCSCPNRTDFHGLCKHIFAVYSTFRGELGPLPYLLPAFPKDRSSRVFVHMLQLFTIIFVVFHLKFLQG